jgi:hypothetical protein
MIQVSNYFLIVCLLLYMHPDCFLVLLPYMHIYLLPYMHMLLLYEVAIPPPLLSLMPFVECEQVTGLRQRLLRFSCALQSAHVPELEPDVIPNI